MRITSLILALLLVSPVAAQSEDYLMIFAADAPYYKATKAHAFAALVRIEKCDERRGRVVEVVSLSWLPATMKVRAFALRPETGRNVPLTETFETFLATGSRICMWGPYRIQPEFAEMFKARVILVESEFKYKGASLTSPRNVCDCARSIEEMIDPRRRYIGVFGYGAAAASVIVQKCAPWIIEPEQSHFWVASVIGLDRYPLIRRPFGDYTSRCDQMKAAIREQ